MTVVSGRSGIENRIEIDLKAIEESETNEVEAEPATAELDYDTSSDDESDTPFGAK